MGLNSNCSYIIAFGGNQSQRAIGGPSGGGPGITPEPGPIDGGNNGIITYTDNGYTYYLRYATVMATSGDEMSVTSAYMPYEENWGENLVENILSTCLVAVVDAAVENIPLGTIASLLFGPTADSVYVELVYSSLVILAQSRWTINYLQVWNPMLQTWEAAQSSEYVISMAYCAGISYDPVTNAPVQSVYAPNYFTTYSRMYYETEARIQDAIYAYNHDTLYVDTITYVDYYWGNEDGEVLFNQPGEPLFTHQRAFPIIFPDT